MEDDLIPNSELATSIRSVIDCYFGSDNKGQQLVKHQLDSYNDFISRKLEQIIDGFNPIDLYNTYIPEMGCFRHIVSISMSNPTVSKPTICEKDGSTKVMLPNDARLRNMTYAAPLTVDVTLTAKTYLPETGEYSMETKRMDGVNLGRVPVMVRSRYCVLSQQQVPPEADECRYDYGGYFVINGNEKVVIRCARCASLGTQLTESIKWLLTVCMRIRAVKLRWPFTVLRCIYGMTEPIITECTCTFPVYLTTRLCVKFAFTV